MMLEKFTKNIRTNFPFLENSRFFVAVSGGIDSMVLVHLFQHFKFEFGLLHCNFKLRGEESEADMRFIHDYANENNLNLKIGFFETAKIAFEMKTSIQVAARELRYSWFYEQMEENNAFFVATAHHADDNLETFIINLSRGTGLDGLTGIPEINDKIIRPLLPFSRKEIEDYAKKHHLKWREDSSNASDKYLRNKIRHQLIPVLKDLNPNFLESFQNTQSFLQNSQELVKDAAYIVYKEVVTENDSEIRFNVEALKQISHYKSYLYEWLKDFGFKAWNDIYNLVDAQSGKQVFSENYRLLKDRNFLILQKIEDSNTEIYFVAENQIEVKIPLNITFEMVKYISKLQNTTIFVDKNLLQFPLSIRKHNEGDFFYPAGMKGKKKISKFFKDEKMSLIEKEKTWLLCSKNEIIWVMGKRADERFVATEATENILKISIL